MKGAIPERGHRGFCKDGRKAARLRSPVCSRGLTLVEVAVAMMLIGIVTASTIYALNMVNQHATSGRHSTHAAALVKDRIDEALTIFYAPPNNIPAILEPTGDLPLVEDNIPVYVTDGDQQMLVTGTMETMVEDVPDTLQGTRRITVRLRYTYRGEEEVMEMSTIRAPIN